MNQQPISKRKNAFINIMLSFLIMVLSGWIADAINGAVVFPWLLKGWLLLDPKYPPLWWSIFWPVLFSIAWFALFIVLYQRRATFLPVEILRVADPNDVMPHQVVVLTVSRTSWTLIETPEKTLQLVHQYNKKIIALPKSLDDALNILTALDIKQKYTWEQSLRALKSHQKAVQRVYLIGSTGTGGTVHDFEDCRRLICYYFPMLKSECIVSKAADFNSLGELLGEYRAIISLEYHRLNQLMIDVTGGTKVVSIAASIVTLEHTAIEFQYVETEGEKRIRTFNVGGGTESDGF